VLGIIASLVFVGLQLRQAEDTAYETLSESTIIRGIEMGARFKNPLLEVFREQLFARLSEFEKNEPHPKAEVMWCGVR
jgi:hypothetical protein